jgi:hypothetical protein
MKPQVILARTTSGCAALFVNQNVVMDAASTVDVNKLADAARNFSAALQVTLIECTLEAPPDRHGNWSKVNWAELVSELPTFTELPDSVPVRIWDAYELEEGATAVDTHSFEIRDQRQNSGQARLIVTAQAASPEPDLLDVLLEVQASPFNAAAYVPVAHVHVDMDDPVISILKLGDKLLVRPNTGVRLEHEVVVIDGKPEDVVVIS